MKKVILAISLLFVVNVSWADNGLPNIMITGYWNPTGQMIAHFSIDPELNPDGWQGENWEGKGFNVYSFFPEPGTYEGMFEVDYQETWEDFWAVTDTLHPIAVISFGAGAGPWEIEYNARNLTNWVEDYEWPLYPTPNPPDSTLPIGVYRNSSLPVENIEMAVDEQTNIDAWVDWYDNPGAFLCEYIAYLSMWYRDMHVEDDFYPCFSGGMIHVAGNIAVEDAAEATDITVREVIYDLLENVIDVSGIVEVSGGLSPQGTQITFQGEGESYNFTINNPDGLYTIPNIPLGTYHMEANLDNMYFQFMDVEITSDEIIDLFLLPSDMAIEGYVQDGETQEPLDAYIYNQQTGFNAYPDTTGFYHIICVEAGQYILKANYWGYQEFISDSIIVTPQDTTEYNILMSPLENAGSIEGTITNVLGNPISGIQVTLVDVELPPVYTNSDGYYQFSPLVPDYDYQISLSHINYESQIEMAYVGFSQNTVVDFVMGYVEAFEETHGGFVAEGGFSNEWEWGTPTANGGPEDGPYSGENCWGTDLDNLYNMNRNFYLYSPPYALNLSDSPQLVLYNWYQIEEGWDGGNIQISNDDGETWSVLEPVDGYPDQSVIALSGLPGFTGDSQGWIRNEFDLSDYADQDVKFRMRFASTNNSDKGWFFDNFIINGGLLIIAQPENLEANVDGNSVNLTWDNPVTQSPIVALNLYRKLDDEIDFGDPIAHVSPEEISYIDAPVQAGTYIYAISASFSDGQESPQDTTIAQVSTGIGDTPKVFTPTHFALNQNYPNPFNPTTVIDFALPKKSNVSLKIYDVSGRLVKTLTHEPMEAGYHSLLWDGTTTLGQNAASGVYIYTIDAGKYRSTKSMILLK